MSLLEPVSSFHLNRVPCTSTLTEQLGFLTKHPMPSTRGIWCWASFSGRCAHCQPLVQEGRRRLIAGATSLLQ